MMQKRGAYSFKNFLMTILIISVFIAGTIAVFAAHGSTKYVEPLWAKNNTEYVYNVTINWTSGNSIDEVRVTAPTNFTVLSAVPKAGWNNATVGQVVTYTASGGGSWLSESQNMNYSFFQVNVTTEADTGSNNAEWTVVTNDDIGGDNTTAGLYTSSDGSAPAVTVNNATNGAGNLITTFDSTYYLNASASVVNITATETESGFSNLFLYYNLTGLATTGSTSVAMATGDTGTTRVYSATIPAQSNGTVVSFAVFVNDSVNNNNVELAAFNNTNAGYNFTIDGDLPAVTILTLTDGLGADDDFITSTTDYLINVSVTDTTSNVKSPVQIKCDSGSYINMILPAAGNNWNISTSMSTLVCDAGDGVKTLTIRAYDNVSNKNESETITVTVDDDVPTVFNMNSNVTYNFTNSVTDNISITLNASDYINPDYDVTINGSRDPRSINAPLNQNITTHNLTNNTFYTMDLGEGARNDTSSYWVINKSLDSYGCIPSNSSSGPRACILQFNVTDLGLRENISESITIYIDSTAPSITNKVTTNQTDEATNVYNNSEQFNVSITTTDNIISAYVNTTSGSNNKISLFNASGGDIWYNASTTASDLGCAADGGTCTINFTVTDKAGNINNTESLDITIDDSAPSLDNITTNITVQENRTRSDTPMNISVNVWDRLTNVTEVTIKAGSITTTLSNNSPNSVNANWLNKSGLPVDDFGCTAGEANCTITFIARDIAGNKNASETMELVIDDRAPRIMNFSVNVSSVSSTTEKFNISIVVQDPNLNLQSFSNVSATNGTTRVNFTKGIQYDSEDDTYYWYVAETDLDAFGCSSNGDCTIQINATDDIGNINSSSNITITLDATAPNITGINVPSAAEPSSTITVTAIAQDEQGVNGSRAYVDGYTDYTYLTGGFGGSGTNINVTGSINLATACDGVCVDGTHTVYIQANNTANTWSTATAQGAYMTFNIGDATAPSINAVISPTGGAVTTNTVVLNVTTTEASTCRYNETDIQYGSMATSSMTDEASNIQHYVTLTGLTNEQAYTYYVRCADTAGNNMTSSTAIAFTVYDGTAMMIVNGPSGTITDNTPPLNVSTNKSATCKYSNTTNNYASMTAFGATSGTSHNHSLTTLTDNYYNYYISCRETTSGKLRESTLFFDLDTMSLYSITRPSTKHDYWTANKWSDPFTLRTWLLENLTTPLTSLNASHVLDSISGSYTKLFAYNGSQWLSYLPDDTSNDFINFSINDQANNYYLYMNKTDRIEIT